MLVGDAVLDPAVALAAASGVSGPEGFKQRSIAAVAAAMATASDGSCEAVGVEGALKPVATSGEAAPSHSATVALDCRVIDDVGGVV